MKVINPKKLSWKAPTENTDGTPIAGALSYTLGVMTDTGVFSDVASFPGSLNPDGTYEALFADMPAFGTGTVELALKAFYVEQPELVSDWSSSITASFGVVNPNAPFGLAVS